MKHSNCALWAGPKKLRVSFLLLVCLLMGCGTAIAQVTHARWFTYEYTRQSGQLIVFYNLTNATNVVTVSIYQPDSGNSQE